MGERGRMFEKSQTLMLCTLLHKLSEGNVPQTVGVYIHTLLTGGIDMQQLLSAAP